MRSCHPNAKFTSFTLFSPCYSSRSRCKQGLRQASESPSSRRLRCRCFLLSCINSLQIHGLKRRQPLFLEFPFLLSFKAFIIMQSKLLLLVFSSKKLFVFTQRSIRRKDGIYLPRQRERKIFTAFSTSLI